MRLRFAHFTYSLDGLIGILSDGLLIRPRRRNVWKYFKRGAEYRDREPQQFGMVSLHSYRIRPNRKCLKQFGSFGVELSPLWVSAQGFRKVVYIREKGSHYDFFKTRFDDALDDLEKRLRKEPSNDAFPKMAYTNRNVAGWYGATKWVEFLEWFECMEPRKHRYQKEWRYSRSDPYYSKHSVEELVDDLRRKDNWTQFIHVLAFNSTDVVSVYLPKKYHDEFRHRASYLYSNCRLLSTPEFRARIAEISRR
jgi:hypothetical protein